MLIVSVAIVSVPTYGLNIVAENVTVLPLTVTVRSAPRLPVGVVGMYASWVGIFCHTWLVNPLIYLVNSRYLAFANTNCWFSVSVIVAVNVLVWLGVIVPLNTIDVSYTPVFLKVLLVELNINLVTSTAILIIQVYNPIHWASASFNTC